MGCGSSTESDNSGTNASGSPSREVVVVPQTQQQQQQQQVVTVSVSGPAALAGPSATTSSSTSSSSGVTANASGISSSAAVSSSDPTVIAAVVATEDDKKAADFIQAEAKEIAAGKARVFITRETVGFVDFRTYPDVGNGLSGSSQPNPPDLVALPSRVNQPKVIDLDLREEPHFFADDKSICYEVEPAEASEWYHVGTDAVVDYERDLFNRLISPVELWEHVPGSFDELDRKDLHAVPYTTKVQESYACATAGVHYERVGITDGQRPKDQDVERLLIMFDVFCNARKQSLSAICAKHPIVPLLQLVAPPKEKPAGAGAGAGAGVSGSGKVDKPKPVKPPTLQDHVYFTWKVDRADFMAKWYRFCFDHSEQLHSKSDRPAFLQYIQSLRNEYSTFTAPSFNNVIDASSSDGTAVATDSSALSTDGVTQEQIDKKAADIIAAEAKVVAAGKARVFITRETASFVDFRVYPSVGGGLSGSSQPNPPDLVALATKVGKPLVIDLDLREEPHFYIDQKSICYEVEPAEASEWYHIGKEQALAYEQDLFNELVSPLDLWEHVPGAFDETDKKDAHAVPFSEKLTEADACAAANVVYERTTITDGQRPKDEDVEHLLEVFHRAYTDGYHLHCHCRDGHGRTNTTMIMYNIFCEARDKSLQQICSDHPIVDVLQLVSPPKEKKVDGSSAAPKADAPAPAPKPPTLQDHVYFTWKVDRADFLAKFYRFCFDHGETLHQASSPPKFLAYIRSLKNEYS